ncbi:hypothetical protein Zmor_019749 [Zophobas morio]|uniref:Uncharacterized protein n=1 Tax=Zophobas morio TaxID=2755281 RepID=A0AA38M8P6_9CUCU|nr:hypothetical protein Zmor_019749 [Zophobas morio]
MAPSSTEPPSPRPQAQSSLLQNRTFLLVTGTRVVIARDRHKLDGRPRHSEALAVSGRFVKPLSATRVRHRCLRPPFTITDSCPNPAVAVCLSQTNADQIPARPICARKLYSIDQGALAPS